MSANIKDNAAAALVNVNPGVNPTPPGEDDDATFSGKLITAPKVPTKRTPRAVAAEETGAAETETTE